MSCQTILKTCTNETQKKQQNLQKKSTSVFAVSREQTNCSSIVSATPQDTLENCHRKRAQMFCRFSSKNGSILVTNNHMRMKVLTLSLFWSTPKPQATEWSDQAPTSWFSQTQHSLSKYPDNVRWDKPEKRWTRFTDVLPVPPYVEKVNLIVFFIAVVRHSTVPQQHFHALVLLLLMRCTLHKRR